jgi:hypothetical protein
MAEINIDRIGGTGGGPTPLPLGNLKVDNPLSTTLQIVKDTGGNASALLISTTEVTNRGGGAIITNTAFGIGALITNTSGSSNTCHWCCFAKYKHNGSTKYRFRCAIFIQ